MAVGLALLLVPCGCAGGNEIPGFRRLGVTPAVGPLPGTHIFEPVAGEWTYLITSGDGSGTRTVVRRSATSDHGAQWVDDIGTQRSEYWRIDDSGNLVMLVAVEHAREAITLFDPPLVIAPATLLPGKPFAQQVSMRVMDLADPTRERYAGTAQRTMVYADNQLLQTPLGRIPARRVEITFRANLKLANAETTSTLFVYGPFGVVVAYTRERHRLMRVPVSGSEQWLVLEGRMVGE